MRTTLFAALLALAAATAPAIAGPVIPDGAAFQKAARSLAGQRVTTRCWLEHKEFSARALTCHVKTGVGPWAKIRVILGIEGVHMRRAENFRAVFLRSDDPQPWGEGADLQVVVSGVLSKPLLDDKLWDRQVYEMTDVVIEPCGFACSSRELQ